MVNHFVLVVSGAFYLRGALRKTSLWHQSSTIWTFKHLAALNVNPVVVSLYTAGPCSNSLRPLTRMMNERMSVASTRPHIHFVPTPPQKWDLLAFPLFTNVICILVYSYQTRDSLPSAPFWFGRFKGRFLLKQSAYHVFSYTKPRSITLTWSSSSYTKKVY